MMKTGDWNYVRQPTERERRKIFFARVVSLISKRLGVKLTPPGVFLNGWR